MTAIIITAAELQGRDVGGLAISAAAERMQAPSKRPAEPDLPISPSWSSAPKGKHIVHWFRKGLRLHDNPALREALVGATTFRCIFIIDPWFASSSNVGINKWRFLLQCLEDLDNSLKELNSRLYVVRGQPADALPKLFREWGTTALTFEEDPEPFGRVRDHNIIAKCREVGITVTSRVSHTLYKLDDIIDRNGGKAPLTYHQFQALVASMPPPPLAVETVTKHTINGAVTPISEDHDLRFGVPTLEELGFETEDLKPPLWIGGETEGLTRLERHLERKAWVATFGPPKMTPQSLLASETGLSPYLRFGCLSTRRFYYELTELYKRVKHERPPLSLHGQILWREFFYCAATRNPNFDRMQGNPICVQIPWECNQDALAKWANGQSGFPWIDAIMIQLKEEGWIHHLARHAVACFLTRGNLWISWEEGMKVFDELLLDADWSVNAGMWMWLSCSSFFQQFIHCYCPVRFGRKTDPNGDFIRKYLPVLKGMPTQYIHEPWLAPEDVQATANCIVGRDYPLPIIDHHKASKTNVKRMKQVYTQLAKYMPVSLNMQMVPRPNVIQSPPSPTSIILNINQSNYLCSETPEPESPLATTEFKEEYIFLKPTYNQVVIVHQVHKQVLQCQPSAEVTEIITNIQNSLKSKNYDFKKLAISNSTSNEQDTLLNETNDVCGHIDNFDEHSTSESKLCFDDNVVTENKQVDEQNSSPTEHAKDCHTTNRNELQNEPAEQNTINTDNIDIKKDTTPVDDKTSDEKC
ncbi:cryptochrome-1-like isoform X1 [Pararge aegeria]|uniref:cryptochrome-1-like isoform X1 n=2 Tax=Pararge aegeria TaxID=116150 RepID=UPI0019D160D9|nr:cryptochrome-1-like isoform X1 [Pararge aegeria]